MSSRWERGATYVLAGALLLGALTACGTPRAAVPPSKDAIRASIKIDATHIIRDIPRGLFGTNLEWFRNANGIWDSATHQIQPRLLPAIQAIGISMIRFPGGALADYYHWRDGVGPVEQRPVREHILDGQSSPNSFGPDELQALSRQLGVEPLISVNVLTGTAEEAAAWVAYCNRPGAPQRVRFWEIGNEPYMKHDGATASSSMRAAEYASKVVSFSQAMRKADSEIKILAAGGMNFGRYNFVTDPLWDKVVLEQAGPFIDYLSVHNAYGPVLINDEKLPVEQVYQSLLAFPKLVRENLEALDAQINESPARGRVRLAVTEWGPLFHVLPSSKWVDHPVTLGSGIFVASLMQTFLNSPRLDIANFFKLTEGGFMGWIGGDGIPKPTAQAFSLYSKHFGSRLAATWVQSPSFDAKPAGVVAASQGSPYVEAVSSLSADGLRLYAIITNKHLGAVANADLDIQGFEASPEGRKWVLTGPGVDANNGLDLPQVPGLTWARQAESTFNPQFYRAAEDRIQIAESGIEYAGGKLVLALPPLSVTAIELTLPSHKRSAHAAIR